jgi:hypothetical protein
VPLLRERARLLGAIAILQLLVMLVAATGWLR